MQRQQVLRGDRLRAARESARLTQEELALRVRTSKAQINRYETGKQDPSAELLVRLSGELSISVDYLLGLVMTPGEHVQADLSAHELKLLAAFRKFDVEGVMRTMFEGGRPKPDQEVHVSG